MKHLPIRDLLKSGLHLMRRNWRQMAVYALIIWVLALFLRIGLSAVYLSLLSSHDINYYKTTHPPQWYWALSLGGICSLGWGLAAGYQALNPAQRTLLSYRRFWRVFYEMGLWESQPSGTAKWQENAAK